MKSPSIEWECIFINYTPDNALVSRIYKELTEVNKTNYQVNKYAKEINSNCFFPEEEI